MKIQSSGGYFGPEASQETPDTHTTLFEYADGTLFEFATRGQFTNDEGTQRIGNLFYGTKGWVWIDGDGRKWQSYLGPKNEPGPGANVPAAASGGSDPLVLTSTELPHYQNFVDAIRANDAKRLNSGILDGHLSSALPHLANIAYRVGHALTLRRPHRDVRRRQEGRPAPDPRVPQGLRDSEDDVRRLALAALVLGRARGERCRAAGAAGAGDHRLPRAADHREARRHRPDRRHARANQRVPRRARGDGTDVSRRSQRPASTSSTRPASA